jgi:hypothetical protein
LDAVGLEYAFAELLGYSVGARGEVNDADVFRNADPTRLSKLLETTADRLHEKLADIPRHPSGSPGARIGVAIDDLREMAELLRNNHGTELHRDTPRAAAGQTYQWGVIGALVMILAAILEPKESHH